MKYARPDASIVTAKQRRDLLAMAQGQDPKLAVKASKSVPKPEPKNAVFFKIQFIKQHMHKILNFVNNLHLLN